MRRATASFALALLALAPIVASAQQQERLEFENRVKAAMGRGADAPSQPGAGSPQKPMATPSDGDADGKLGSESMRKANRAAAEILKRRMNDQRPDDAKLLREAVGADVVVVSGVYDRVQDVLRAVEVKHVVIPPSLLEKLDLLPTQTLMVNCPGMVSPTAVKKIRDFVLRGGYLVTTDWAIGLAAKAFPGTIEHNGVRTPSDVVAAEVLDKSEPLLSHVRVLKDQPRWWLEGSSFPIRILDKQRVHVLMTSSEMKKKYGDGAVVVSFHAGDGKVLHMTSHFYLQQAKLVSQAERKSGSSFAKDAGLADKDVAELKRRGVDPDAVKSGELNSAYSMQQVSANLLVEKQKQNRELMNKRYRGRIDAAKVPLAQSPTAAPPKDGAKTLGRDWRVEVLEEKDGKVKVRDLFGDEGWVPAEAVKK